MGILTDDMRRLVDEQKLAFHATVCPDGSPNLSPKGSTRVWDDDHLFFADICSPQTIANIRAGSLLEVNVVDPFVRKGYRFKGPARMRSQPAHDVLARVEIEERGEIRFLPAPEQQARCPQQFHPAATRGPGVRAAARTGRAGFRACPLLSSSRRGRRARRAARRLAPRS